MLLDHVLALPPLRQGISWLAGGPQEPRTFLEAPYPAPHEARASRWSGELTVVTWNIAWGCGPGSEGTVDRKSRAHFESATRRMGELLRELGADLALLQEIDFDSTRSRRMDQVSAIARHAAMPYAAAATAWSARWVPFPYWPPRRHFGRMRSGGAILSRWPIASNEVELLPKPEKNPWWYNLFYVFRFLQRCDVETPGGLLRVFNTHLEAVDTENREAQARHLARRLTAERVPGLLFGGDLNTVPPESSQRCDYPDEPETDHRGDRTLALLRGVSCLRDLTPAEVFLGAERELLTYPSYAPNRKLDFLFAAPDFELLEARVARETGDLSDHFPLVARLRFGAPRTPPTHSSERDPA